jgi:hypothetical protein
MLSSLWARLKARLGLDKKKGEPPGDGGTINPPRPLAPTLEVVAGPGAGKSSFVWALVYTLRKLSWVWPHYLCWSQDEATEGQILRLHGVMQERGLPMSGDEEVAGGGRSYRLLLKRMARWGERPLVLMDDRALQLGEAETADEAREINWGAPILWLLNLVDLDSNDAALIDLQLDRLVRARLRSARSYEGEPMKLIVALNKADRLPYLPDSLRRYLKADPLAAVIDAERNLTDTGVRPGEPALHFDDEAVALYLRTLRWVHEETAAWLMQTLAGRLLVRRAAERQLQVRFCVLSSTGSDLRSGGRLAIPWSPRRVLDPLFWALDLEDS